MTYSISFTKGGGPPPDKLSGLLEKVLAMLGPDSVSLNAAGDVDLHSSMVLIR